MALVQSSEAQEQLDEVRMSIMSCRRRSLSLSKFAQLVKRQVELAVVADLCDKPLVCADLESALSVVAVDNQLDNSSVSAIKNPMTMVERTGLEMTNMALRLWVIPQSK
jgi:hypothetical protein